MTCQANKILPHYLENNLHSNTSSCKKVQHTAKTHFVKKFHLKLFCKMGMIAAKIWILKSKSHFHFSKKFPEMRNFFCEVEFWCDCCSSCLQFRNQMVLHELQQSHQNSTSQKKFLISGNFFEKWKWDFDFKIQILAASTSHSKTQHQHLTAPIWDSS